MSFGSNNSQNVANLLRFDKLDSLPVPTQSKRQLPALINAPSAIPTNQPPRIHSRERQEIPLEQVFTPEERNRRKTPSSDNYPNGSNSEQFQLQSMKVRLEQIVRYYDERHSNLESKLMVRLNELQNFIMKEVPRIDNTTMITADLAGMKEALKEMRRQQQQHSHQVASLRAEKGSQISAQNSREKEKSTVLFMQLVRLGDTVEKMNEQMTGVSRTYENKLLELESKLSTSEKNLAIMSHRTSSGSDVLNQLGDKLISRLQTSQSNLLILGKEQVRDKEAIAKLTVQNERIGEDLQLLLRNMQTDFQSRLETKVSETVNRLMMEHQDRIKSHEEIRKNLDLRERVNQERLSNEKMESKARYDSMDSLVRNEFMKKDDSIRALHLATQEKFRSMAVEMQEQVTKRKEQEILFRNEIKRVQDSLRNEYELYRSHESAAIEKFSDIVKTEVQVRLSSELDLKKMTSDLAIDLVNDLNNLKEALASSNKKLSQALREVSNESAERAGQLSHYVDQEVKQLGEVVGEKYNKMKNVFSKIAEQLRNHLLATEGNRKNVESRLSAVEGDFQKLKEEVNEEVSEFYNDLEKRLKEEKEFVETVVFKKNNDLTLRVSKLEEYTNQYFELLKSGIQDNKDLLSKKLKNGEGKPAENEEQMKELRSIIFNIRNLTEALKEQNEADLRDLRKDISQIDGRQKQMLLDLEGGLNSKLGRQSEKNKQIDERLNELSVKINSLRADAGGAGGDKLKKIEGQLEGLSLRLKSEVVDLRGEIAKIEQRVP